MDNLYPLHGKMSLKERTDFISSLLGSQYIITWEGLSKLEVYCWNQEVQQED